MLEICNVDINLDGTSPITSCRHFGGRKIRIVVGNTISGSKVML